MKLASKKYVILYKHISLVFTINNLIKANRKCKIKFKVMSFINNYRQISEHMLVYPNVRLTEWRLSTIWGGASLLKMILRAIKEALALWSDWDFFINLSALDFPIDTDDNLVSL